MFSMIINPIDSCIPIGMVKVGCNPTKMENLNGELVRYEPPLEGWWHKFPRIWRGIYVFKQN